MKGRKLEKIIIRVYYYYLYVCCGVLGLLMMSGPAIAGEQIGLYDVWEGQVTNSKNYSNPFDFNVIELRGTFIAPSGRQVDFFGFYDGDGNGGQAGNIWKLRFMPDELGTWTYTYNWTDGTSGGTGTFEVVDSNLPGPLRVATDNSWYFMNERGEPFHWRGYDLHVTVLSAPSRSFLSSIDWFKNLMQKSVIDRGYNFTMVDGLIDRIWSESWWEDSGDRMRFSVPAWTAWEEALHLAKDNGVYVTTFAGMIFQGHEYNLQDFKVFLHYWIARFAPFYNFMGWSPTWEWTDIWRPNEVNEIMQYLYDLDPWKRLLSAHDCAHSSFSGWLSFSMRQAQSIDVFEGNSRTAGQLQGSCDSPGGIAPSFLDMPIIGSEDIWEVQSGKNGQPRNADEVRRAAWGIMMAGVMPLYSEWHPDPPPSGGNGEGEPEVRRMFDFLYANTRYRKYKQLNGLVSGSSGQICSGIPGEEYLVYDENGGSIRIDLSSTSPSAKFPVLWFNPKTGTEQFDSTVNGGGTRTLTSPHSGDAVVLIGGIPPDNSPPSPPQNVSAVAKGESQIDISWQAANDPESGISDYYIYRNGSKVGGVTVLSFSDTGLSENTTYSYQVSAVNSVGLESILSSTVVEKTLPDITPPTILSVNSTTATDIIVAFSERLEESSAEKVSNYRIDSGVTISNAILNDNSKNVRLTTSVHQEGVTYTLTVSNIRDASSKTNTISANSSMSYEYVKELKIANLKPSRYQLARLEIGDEYYLDRSYTITSIPSEFESFMWVKTANDDKFNGDENFISFETNRGVSIFVGYDTRTSLPAWLNSWTSIGKNIETTDVPLKVYRKDFLAGEIRLGGNYSASSMYVVLIETGEVETDSGPPAPPAGIRVNNGY